MVIPLIQLFINYFMGITVEEETISLLESFLYINFDFNIFYKYFDKIIFDKY